MEKKTKIITPLSLEECNVTPKLNFEALEQEAYISLRDQIPLPPIALSIGKITKQGVSYPIPFGTYGNYSCIVGASKSRKTFAKSMFTAAYIGGNAQEYCGVIQSHQKGTKVVLDFDTEQGKWHAQQAFKRVEQMIGMPYTRYLTYGLRKYSYTDRLAFIEYMIYKHKDQLGLVLIDGIADLVSDINNLVECNAVSQKFMTWTQETGCHLIGILHKNFGTEKPTGHLGSTVLKKAETIVYVEVDSQDKQKSNLRFEYTRSAPIDPFSFGINEQWLPYVIEEGTAQTSVFI